MGNTDHFRDDITRLAHLNGIADAKAELMDKILIVQGRTGNGSTRQKDRVKAGRRGKNTSAANCDLNAAQRCLLYLWRILKRNCPAWELLVEPIKSRCAKSFTLITAPSISKSSLARF